MNLLTNGGFARGLTGWTVEKDASKGGVLAAQFAPGDGSPEPGSCFLPAGNTIRQSVYIAQPGRYNLDVQTKTLEPNAEAEFLTLQCRIQSTSEATALSVSLPYTDRNWHAEQLVMEIGDYETGTYYVELITGNLRSGVFVDSIEFAFVETDACAPLVRELAARRGDTAFQKHPEARYRQVIANAIREAPYNLWPPIRRVL